MLLHRANTIGTLQSARMVGPQKPSFVEGTFIEEHDRSGNVLSCFKWGRLLGKGGFAKCYEGTDTNTGAVYAIKVIDRATLAKAKMQSKLHTEIAIHRRMNHPNIVRFYKTFQDEWYVYIILEKCSNQTLMEISRTRPRFSTAETQHIMLQSISAINYMHQEGVIHRDLKLGNMMMDTEMSVKIGDFGLAAELRYDGERKRTVCGTPNYIAPEILDGAREGHSFEVDVWSLGVILYTLLVGEPPFQTNDVKTTYSRIRHCRFSFPANISISEHGKDLVYRILQSNPEKRPSLVEVRQHPFFACSPTSAPITLFSESQRRRLEAARNPLISGDKGPIGLPMSAVPSAATNTKNGLREPLKQLWGGNNQQMPWSRPPSPRDCNQAAKTDGARQGKPTVVDKENKKVGTFAPRGSLPTGPTFSGWAGKVDSRPPSPKTSRPPSPNEAQGYFQNAGAPTATGTIKNAPDYHDEDDEKHHLTVIHDRLHRTLHNIVIDDEAGEVSAPTVWVTDYADFSAKYGLAYRLNTGHTAVHYNDSTKMVWEPSTNNVEYYARVKEVINGEQRAMDERQSFNMDSFPEELNKKVTLIKYFKSYLTKAKGKKDGVEVVTCSPYNGSSMPSENMISNMVYVKRWLLTSEAMVFRLSNRAVQVCFFDKTEVILSSETREVTFTDSNGSRVTLPLSKGTTHSEEMTKRLKFTQEVLRKLIN